MGAGTFKPVTAERIGDHLMHAEYIDVQLATIQSMIDEPGRVVVAVGTTSLRTLESLYWMGVKASRGAIHLSDLSIKQWDPYEITTTLTPKHALQALLLWMQDKNLSRLITKTQILIAPGYQLKVAQALITNFHQPQSTLLLLIAAITGKNWRGLYQHALDNNFRFLSYGDGCLLYNSP